VRNPKRKRLVDRLPIPVFRIALLAGVALAASVYAVMRYYSHPPLPMLVPVVNDAGEIPAPDLEAVDP
jgi:hypothetical protein